MRMQKNKKKRWSILTAAVMCTSFFSTMPVSSITVSAENVVAGDCDGSGKFEQSDIFLLHDALLGTINLSELSAGTDVDGNGTVNAVDLALQKAQYLDSKKEKDVTVLVYQCGSDLESKAKQATTDLLEMYYSAPSDHLSVVVETGGSIMWYNSISAADANYRICFHGNEMNYQRISDKPKNMGDSQTLIDFITESTAAFPADRYALILWDHGGGPIFGACNDELYDDVLLVPEITYALEQSQVHFEWIGFDCCLMGSAEVAYALRPYADYMVGSEEAESGLGWAYEHFLSEWALDTNRPTEDIMHDIIDDMVRENRKYQASATLAAYDLSKADALLASLKEYMNDVYTLSKQNMNAVLQGRSQALEYGEGLYDLVDIGSLADHIQTAHSDSVKQALNDMVIYKGQSGQESATGATIWFFKEHPEIYQDVGWVFGLLGIDETYTNQICEMASRQVQPFFWGRAMQSHEPETDDPMVLCGLKEIEARMREQEKAELTR